MNERTYVTLESGQGVPLILLHGMMGEPENWQGTFPSLPATSRAIALRFPFFEADGADLDSVPAVTDYAQGFIDKSRFDRFVVCGNSLGGHVALDLALRMPDRVCGLVLTGSSGLFERTFGTVVTRPPRSWFVEKIREIFYDPRHATDKMVDAVINVMTDRRNVRTLVQIAKSAKRDNVAERLKKMACPVLLVWGKQDLITPPEVAAEFHSYLPGSELVWVDKCGHAAMIEHPAEFARVLGRWWERHICPAGVAPGPGVKNPAGE